jgi:hypothetical protein
MRNINFVSWFGVVGLIAYLHNSCSKKLESLDAKLVKDNSLHP